MTQTCHYYSLLLFEIIETSPSTLPGMDCMKGGSGQHPIPRCNAVTSPYLLVFHSSPAAQGWWPCCVFIPPSSDQPVPSGKPATPTRASKWDPGIPVCRKRARPRQVRSLALQLRAGRPGVGYSIPQGFKVISKQGQLSWISLCPGTTVRVSKRLFL